MTEFMVQIRRGDEWFDASTYGGSATSVESYRLLDVDTDIALEALELLKKSVKGDEDGE